MLARIRLPRVAQPRVLPVAGCIGLALLHGLLLYGASGHDDSHITYWAAESLLNHGEILNYGGARVEQSSTLLLTLILAGAGVFLPSLSMPTVGVLLSMLAGAGAIIVAWRLAVDMGARPAWMAPVLLAVSPNLPYWSMSGMEGPLAALCLAVAAWGLWRCTDGPVAAGGVAGLLAGLTGYLMVRPEAPFVALAGLIGYAAFAALRRDWRAGRTALAAVIAVVLIAGTIMAWRWSYFGRLFPEPVYAKAGGLDVLDEGLLYLRQVMIRPHTAVALIFALAASVAALVGRMESRRAMAAGMLGAFIGAQIAFAVASGGDWMVGLRFVTPVAPLIAVAAVLAVPNVRRFWRDAAFILLIWTATADVVISVKHATTGIPLAVIGQDTMLKPEGGLPDGFSWTEYANQPHRRDLPTVIAMDGIVGDLRAAGVDVSIMGGQMGMVMYYTARRHEIEPVDLRGLVSRQFSDCRDDLPRDRYGLSPVYAQVLPEGGLLDECGMQRPSVIFDLSNHIPPPVLAADYALVYSQGDESRLRSAGAGQEIYVRKDLAPLLKPERFREVVWR